MEKQFIPYELALKLKELGFDEPCIGAYNMSDGNKFMIATQLSSYNINTGKNSDISIIEKVTAPLWQQAFQFLMTDEIPEKYNLSFDVGGWTLFDSEKHIYYDNEKALEKLIKLC